MKSYLLPLFTLSLAASAMGQSTPPPTPDGKWQKQQLTDIFWAEGVAVADVDKDGKMDVLYGPYWFAGPEFTTRHKIYSDADRIKVKQADGTEVEIEGFKGAKTQENGYSNNFQSFAHDMNGDGWQDYVVVSFPGKETVWFENPKGDKAAGEWKKHLVFSPTDNESPMLTDINGDGRPDLLCMSNGHLGFVSYDPENPTKEWKWYSVTPRMSWQKYTHGIGYGDVNGDGRVDLLEGTGWWEQPASLEGAPAWKKHEAKFATKGGAQMYVYDVNGDGRNDVIGSLAAHEYGLAWFEQTADGGWKQHLIVGGPEEAGTTGLVFSQLHALELVDMNGDGVKDIVTGKRFWAHGAKGDPEPNAPAVLWWFELKRDGGKVTWAPHFIDDDSGVGTQFTVADVNGDGKPDVVVGNKKGAYVHTQK
jgi:hypothetical protein